LALARADVERALMSRALGHFPLAAPTRSCDFFIGFFDFWPQERLEQMYRFVR
jgi:hypothetical protein